MAFKPEGQKVFDQAIATNSTTQSASVKLGEIVQAYDSTYGSGEFIYLKGVASTVVGSWVTYNLDDHSTALLVGNAVGPVAVAMSACVASEFGFYQISGKAVAVVATGFADNGNCYTDSAGSVDDAIVAGDRVQHAKGASAIGTPSAGLAEVEISRPLVNNALAD